MARSSQVITSPVWSKLLTILTAFLCMEPNRSNWYLEDPCQARPSMQHFCLTWWSLTLKYHIIPILKFTILSRTYWWNFADFWIFLERKLVLEEHILKDLTIKACIDSTNKTLQLSACLRRYHFKMLDLCFNTQTFTASTCKAIAQINHFGK